MDNSMINSKLLKSQMILKGISGKAFAEAQGWSPTTAYRKINGRVAFTAPEIQVCIKFLALDSGIASEIFFASNLSCKDK